MPKGNSAFMKPLKPSPELATVVGAHPISRPAATKKMWDYIKKNGLQDAENRRMINPDSVLAPVLGKGQVSMFEVAKQLNKHLG